MKQFKDYYRTVAWLENLATSAHDQQYMHRGNENPQQYLDRTAHLLKLLGNPHRGFRFIHVAGTAGKGSTVSYLHEILYHAGHTVGSFTSPYATTSIEKIKVNDQLIRPHIFVQLVKKIKPAIAEMETHYQYGRPAYFEIFFALAILYFKKMKCDWVILEVGCGGKYDAGNIIKKSISVITGIGLDHTALLGKTLTKIAGEKAGIIKPHTHCFTTEERPQIRALFKTQCTRAHATLHVIEKKETRTVLTGEEVGTYQKKNIALARAVAEHIGIDKQSSERATQHVLLPCRFEIMQKKPLVIIDGAHNPDKIKSVVHNLKRLTYARLYIMFASAQNKNAGAMIKLLQPHAHAFMFTQFHDEGRAAYAAHAFVPFLVKPITHFCQSDPHAALAALRKKIRPTDALLITGSFYLAGALRTHWIDEQTILKTRNTQRAIIM